MSRKSYTLIELMTVVAIAALLLSLGMPAFRAMIEGDGTGYTASLVKGVIDQTRAKGLGSRSYTAVVFDLEGERPLANHVQAVRGCLVDKEDTGEFTFREWLPESQWKPMDRGGWLLAAGEDADLEADAGTGLKLSDIPDTKLKNVMSELEVKKEQDPGAEKDQQYYAVFFSPYGAMVKPENKIYMLIGEAKMRGETLRYTSSLKDEDKVPVNSLVLSVNPFTGRVEMKPYEND